MKKKKWLSFLLGTVLVMGLAACGGGDDKGGDTASASGQKIYDQKCSGCHGGDLKGTVGPDISKVGATLSKDQILDVIKNGQKTMPPNVVSGDDAEQVAEWLAAKK